MPNGAIILRKTNITEQRNFIVVPLTIIGM